MDGFKNVNNAIGRSAGDAVLRRTARSLRPAITQDDMLARVRSDELVPLATDCGDDSRLRKLAEHLVPSIREVGDKEYGGRFAIGVSIGITTFLGRVATIAALLDVADAAMYSPRQRPLDLQFWHLAPGFSNVVKPTR